MMAAREPKSVVQEKYIVIKSFVDLQDGNYAYVRGDEYPRTGYKPTAERINELASDKNKRKEVLIKKA